MKKTTKKKTKSKIRNNKDKNIMKNLKAFSMNLDIVLYDTRVKKELEELLKAYKNIKPTELIKDKYRFDLLDKIIWDLMEYMNKFYKIKKAVLLEQRKNENILKELEKE